MWAISKKNSKRELSEIKAEEVCTKKITTIRPSADIYDAIKLMKKAKFRRLPVVIKKKSYRPVDIKRHPEDRA